MSFIIGISHLYTVYWCIPHF